MTISSRPIKEAFSVLKNRIGRTPTSLFSLENGNELFVKREDFNPTGSIKDRSIFALIESQENLENIRGVVIASSGNAGISAAYISQILGIKCAVFSWPQISKRKCLFISELGADLFIHDGFDAYQKGGWIYEAESYAREHNFIYLDQFNDTAVISAHEQTAFELFQSCPFLDYIFVGVGSGSTAEGIRRYIRNHHLSTKLILVDPRGGLLYDTFHHRQATSYRHQVESLSPSFIPRHLTDLHDFDDVIQIDDSLIQNARQHLFHQTGLLGGEICGFVYHGVEHYIHMHGITNSQFAILCSDSFMRYV